MSDQVWVIGAGFMAEAYVSVLKSMDVPVTVIGRNEEKVKSLKEKYDVEALSGGLQKFLDTNPERPNYVINAVGVEVLKDVTIDLIHYGIKNILVEKPGIGYPNEIFSLKEAVNKGKSNVLIGYNRRFYSSVLAAEKIISDDGGPTFMSFEFTERTHVIQNLEKTAAEMQNWFLGNSTHVVDTAFYLAGKPKKIDAYYSGSNRLHWHYTSSIFSGAGKTTNDCLFAYYANWNNAGRWWIEVITTKRKLIFRPMERLYEQYMGEEAKEIGGVNYSLDEDFKPGIYLQTKAFLNDEHDKFCTVEEQYKNMENIYIPMSGYSMNQ